MSATRTSGAIVSIPSSASRTDDADRGVEVGLQHDPLLGRRLAERLHPRREERRQVQAHDLQAELAGGDARDVEKVRDEPRLRARRALRDGDAYDGPGDDRGGELYRGEAEAQRRDCERPRDDRDGPEGHLGPPT